MAVTMATSGATTLVSGLDKREVSSLLKVRMPTPVGLVLVRNKPVGEKQSNLSPRS
jgi:hypothetical protein